MNNYLPQFHSWLQNKGYSQSTCRNYLVDLGKYLNYVNRLPQTVSLDIDDSSVVHFLSPEIISLYVSYLSDKSNSSRYLASLNRFCQFAVDQHLISQNPFKKISRPTSTPDLKELVKTYQQYLQTKNTPLSTIRNYINDLRQYISWLETIKN